MVSRRPNFEWKVRIFDNLEKKGEPIETKTFKEIKEIQEYLGISRTQTWLIASKRINKKVDIEKILLYHPALV